MFDPEKVERLYTRNRKVGFVDADDYDELLKLYRAARKEVGHLQDSCDPRYDTNQVG